MRLIASGWRGHEPTAKLVQRDGRADISQRWQWESALAVQTRNKNTGDGAAAAPEATESPLITRPSAAMRMLREMSMREERNKRMTVAESRLQWSG